MTAAWIALTWLQPWDIRLKMDPMTYAALAKNILATGDWSVLHYGEQAYSRFFQHPPLAIWMQAGVFKLFGVSDLAARLLPGVFGLGSVLLAARLGGFTAGLVLLLTAKFLKFAPDFYLDGPLAFWMLAYAAFALRASGLGMAVALAAAFMTKGLVALALPVAAVALIAWDRKRHLRSWLMSIGGAALLLSPWLLWGGGATYLAEYWAQSVSGRARPNGGGDPLGPLRYLAVAYFPWWIALAIGYRRAVHEKRRDLAYLGINALMVVAGFSIVGQSYEHYFLPFYVFAAPVAALGLPKFVLSIPDLTKARVTLAVAGGVFALNFLPLRFHHDRTSDLERALEVAMAQCRGITHVLVPTDEQGFAWGAMATIQWRTPWQTRFDRTHLSPDGKAQAGQILVTPHRPNPSWVEIGRLGTSGLFMPVGSSDCSKSGG